MPQPHGFAPQPQVQLTAPVNGRKNLPNPPITTYQATRAPNTAVSPVSNPVASSNHFNHNGQSSVPKPQTASNGSSTVQATTRVAQDQQQHISSGTGPSTSKTVPNVPSQSSNSQNQPSREEFIGEVLAPLRLKLEESWMAARGSVDHLLNMQASQFTKKLQTQGAAYNQDVKQLKAANIRITQERDQYHQGWKDSYDRGETLAAEVKLLRPMVAQLQGSLALWSTAYKDLQSKLASAEAEVAVAKASASAGQIIQKSTIGQAERHGLGDIDPAVLEELRTELAADLDRELRDKLGAILNNFETDRLKEAEIRIAQLEQELQSAKAVATLEPPLDRRVLPESLISPSVAPTPFNGISNTSTLMARNTSQTSTSNSTLAHADIEIIDLTEDADPASPPKRIPPKISQSHSLDVAISKSASVPITSPFVEKFEDLPPRKRKRANSTGGAGSQPPPGQLLFGEAAIFNKPLVEEPTVTQDLTVKKDGTPAETVRAQSADSAADVEQIMSEAVSEDQLMELRIFTCFEHQSDDVFSCRLCLHRHGTDPSKHDLSLFPRAKGYDQMIKHWESAHGSAWNKVIAADESGLKRLAESI